MKSKILTMLMIASIAIIAFLCGYGISLSEPCAGEGEIIMSFVTDAGNDFSLYREVYTDVMYVKTQKYGGSERSITIMLDPETGKPLTYSNWLKYKN